ncbi:hypothetical protein HAX54_001416, partial [Datura stramonium]|nr:hypothetical protein [Datura stramonium]
KDDENRSHHVKTSRSEERHAGETSNLDPPKLKINWPECILGFKLESSQDPGGPSNVKIDESQGFVLNSLLSKAQDIKNSLGAVVGDLHKCTELLGKLSTDMTSLQAQIYLIQKEGVKSFNLVLKQVESVAAR